VSEQLTFDGMAGLTGSPSPSKGSAQQRRTAKQRAGIPYGVHPLTYALDGMLRTHPDAAADGRTCGNCRFRQVVDSGSKRRYPKCTADAGPCSPSLATTTPSRMSHGSGTDVRRWWPGCIDHQFGDNALSQDAARSGPASVYAE
jgi:hypothetical protein